MSEFDIKGEVNIQTLPVSIATVRLGVDGAPDRVVDRRPTGVHVQELRIGGRPVPLEAFRRIPCEPLDGAPIGPAERSDWVHARLSFVAGNSAFTARGCRHDQERGGGRERSHDRVAIADRASTLEPPQLPPPPSGWVCVQDPAAKLEYQE